MGQASSLEIDEYKASTLFFRSKNWKLRKEQFERIRTLGSGVQAMVDLYQIIGEQHKVAAKMKLSKDDTDTNIIQHEANILRPLKHPGIIEAFGYDSRVGVLFLEAGWKSGISMAESGLTELDIYRVGADLFEALRYLKSRYILHSDIKPNNIMVFPDGVVKLIDFGLATRVDWHGGKIQGGGYIKPWMRLHYYPPEMFDSTDSYSYEPDVFALTACIINAINFRSPPCVYIENTRNGKRPTISRTRTYRNFCETLAICGLVEKTQRKTCEYMRDILMKQIDEMQVKKKNKRGGYGVQISPLKKGRV